MKRKLTPKSADLERRWTVVLVDDHPVVREGLAQRIAMEADFEVCATAEDALAAMRAMLKYQPDLAIVDLTLSNGHGLDVIKDMRVRCPDVRILVFSMHDEALFGERVLCAGAHGYLMKHESPERVLAAMRRVVAGEIAVSPRLAEKLLKTAIGAGGRSSGQDRARLSDRELEVFQLIGQGLATKEIAARLQRSVKTIETHRLRIKRKLGIGSSSVLIATAASQGAEHGESPRVKLRP